MSFISQSSGVNLSFNAELSNLHLFGTERQVRSSYQILCELPLFKVSGAAQFKALCLLTHITVGKPYVLNVFFRASD
jgi:hypothetical protein